MKVSLLCAGIYLVMAGVSQAGSLADFEDLPLAGGSYWNGSDGSGGFTSGGAYLKNNYSMSFGSWDGFAYSNITDNTTSGWGAQFNAITGGGQGGSANYAVGYDPIPSGFGTERPQMTLITPKAVDGLYVTNISYAYYSMQQGDMFAKKFGGASGTDADWFLLAITGKDSQGVVTGTVNFYMADFRSADNSKDYIVNTWEYVDLSSLGVVKSLEFGLSSTDNGAFGMNTPAYFALDTVVPEPVSVVLFGIGMLLMRQKRK